MNSGVPVFRLLALLVAFATLTAVPAFASLPGPSDESAEPTLGRPSGPELRFLGRRVENPSPKRVPTEIHLANGISFDTRTGEPSLPTRLRAREAVAPDEMLSLIVQVQVDNLTQLFL